MKFAKWDSKKTRSCKQWKPLLIIQIELLIIYSMESLQMLDKELVLPLHLRNQDSQEQELEETDKQVQQQEQVELEELVDWD